MDYKNFKLAAAARNRVWAILVLNLLVCAPIGTAIYSSKQKNWAPFWVGTLIFILGLPLALVDLGFTSFIVAPIAATLMLTNKAMSSRRRLGVVDPEQADEVYYDSFKD